jgi:hypothetical protein
MDRGCLGDMCVDTLHKGENDDINNLFSIPEIHQSGYRTCH